MCTLVICQGRKSEWHVSACELYSVCRCFEWFGCFLQQRKKSFIKGFKTTKKKLFTSDWDLWSDIWYGKNNEGILFLSLVHSFGHISTYTYIAIMLFLSQYVYFPPSHHCLHRPYTHTNSTRRESGWGHFSRQRGYHVSREAVLLNWFPLGELYRWHRWQQCAVTQTTPSST